MFDYRSHSVLGVVSIAYDALVALTGWRRWLAAFIGGSLSAAAMPPFHYWPVLFISFPLLVCFLDGIRIQAGDNIAMRYRQAALVGWWFGLGQFLFGLYWIAEAFLVDADSYAWLIPFAAILGPSLLALFVAGAVAVASLLWRPGTFRVILFAVVWTAFEWLRGHIFTGFPWNLMGYTLADYDELRQFASVVGIYGLSFMVVLAAASPAVFLPVPKRLGKRWILPAALGVSLLGLAYWGAGRLMSHDVAFVDGAFVRIVQASIPQSEKWKPENRRAVYDRFMELTQSEGFESRNIIVWPEAALPFPLDSSPAIMNEIAATLGPHRTLLTGAVRVERDPVRNKLTFYNSLHVIKGGPPNALGRHIVATYDKHHLVPFGEYVPFTKFFRAIGLSPVVDSVGGFTPGPGRKTLTLPGGTKISPLICYEIIFPGAVTAPGERPDWIVNVTNDAWYGNTTGPRQHFQMARMRAIETGLPIVRAANTGISAVFDPVGRRLREIKLNESGILDVQLPAALPPTIYFRLGDWVLLFVLIPCLAYILWGRIASGRWDYVPVARPFSE